MKFIHNCDANTNSELAVYRNIDEDSGELQLTSTNNGIFIKIDIDVNYCPFCGLKIDEKNPNLEN